MRTRSVFARTTTYVCTSTYVCTKRILLNFTFAHAVQGDLHALLCSLYVAYAVTHRIASCIEHD